MTKFFRTALLVLITVIISSCSKNTDVTDVEVNNHSDNKKITMISTNTSTGAGVFSFDDYGAYTIWNDGCKSNIIRFDTASNIFTYACTTPGCLHTDDSCTSYVETDGFIFLRDSKTVIVTNNLSQTAGVIEQKIYVADDSCDNRKLLVTLNSHNIYEGDNVFYDGEHLITFLEDTVTLNMYLSKINIGTGEIERLREVDYSSSLVGCSDNGIYIKEYEKFDKTVQSGPSQFKIVEYCPKSDSLNTIFTSPEFDLHEKNIGSVTINVPRSTKAYYFTNDSIYMVDKDTKIVSRTSFASGEETELCVINDEPWNECNILCVSSGYIIISVNGLSKYYSVNISEASYSEVTLSEYNSRYNVYELIYPYTIKNGKVFFFNDGIEYTQTYYLPNGEYEKKTLTMPYLSYISVEDYYNNNDNINSVVYAK